MRPVVFHLADDHMEKGLRAFFHRDNWHHALRCARFELDPDSSEDIFRVGGCTDPGMWKEAHFNLASHLKTHEHAIVLIDEDFDPHPGAARIREDIGDGLMSAGWERERFEVVVIEPMLEPWLWTHSDHVATAFGLSRFAELRAELTRQGLWSEGDPKPRELKRARDLAARLGGRKTGGPIFASVFTALSSRALDQCREPGFLLLRQTLQRWFPPEGAEA